jgi:antitoxin component of MazEF toxin-antitoxin module
MKVALKKHGHSLVIIVPKPILELLGVDAKPGAELDMRTDGKRLVLTPVREIEEKDKQ